MHLGQLYNHLLPERRGHRGGGGEGGGMVVGWGGDRPNAMQCNAMQYFFSTGKWQTLKKGNNSRYSILKISDY